MKLMTDEEVDAWNAEIEQNEKAILDKVLSRKGSDCVTLSTVEAGLVGRYWDTLTHDQKVAVFPFINSHSAAQKAAFYAGEDVDKVFKMHDTAFFAMRPLESPTGRVYKMSLLKSLEAPQKATETNSASSATDIAPTYRNAPDELPRDEKQALIDKARLIPNYVWNGQGVAPMAGPSGLIFAMRALEAEETQITQGHA